MMNRREMLAKSSLAAAAAMMPPTVVLDAPVVAIGPDPLGVRQDFPIVANGRVFLD